MERAKNIKEERMLTQKLKVLLEAVERDTLYDLIRYLKDFNYRSSTIDDGCIHEDDLEKCRSGVLNILNLKIKRLYEYELRQIPDIDKLFPYGIKF